MALTNCKKCGGTIDSSAQTCPHCGAKLQPDLVDYALIGLFGYVFGPILGLLFLCLLFGIMDGC